MSRGLEKRVIGRAGDRESGVRIGPACCVLAWLVLCHPSSAALLQLSRLHGFRPSLLYRSRPSPAWGRGWSAAGLLFSRGGPGGGVANSQSHASGSTIPLADFVHQFESSYHGVRTIRAAFTQTYVTEGKTQVESGVVYFARGGLMRWDYQRPQTKLFISDGKMLLLYVPEEKQFTRTPLKASDDIRVPFRLLLSRLNLQRVFARLEFAPDALPQQPADRVLRCYPKQPFQEDYQQVLMLISPQFDIRRLLISFPDQSSMQFDFEHIERDVPLSRSLFHFIPPPGTEVIEQQ